MIRVLRLLVAEMRYRLAEKAYAIRPYDMHLDARRWCWQRSGRRRSYAALAGLTSDQRLALEHAIRAHLERRAVGRPQPTTEEE